MYCERFNELNLQTPPDPGCTAPLANGGHAVPKYFGQSSFAHSPWRASETPLPRRRRADVEITQVAAIAIAAGMRVDELARVPLSYPTYAGILARVAAGAASQLNPAVNWQAPQVD